MSLVGNVHVVQGDAGVIPVLLGHLSALGYAADANPDMYIKVHVSFGVDEARDLRERSYAKAISKSGRRIFVVVASAISHEAQNALLKTFEEPPGDALFFFVVQSPEMLLPTLRSRAQMLELATAQQSPNLEAKRFLAATPRVRLEMLKGILDKGESDQRDTAGIVSFLADIEREMTRSDISHAHEGIEAVYRARKYVSDRGSLVKPLLEQVALLSPVL